jgi:hypothetical protein
MVLLLFVCGIDVEAEFVVGDSGPGTEGAAHVILHVAQEKMGLHVLVQHQFLATNLTRQHGLLFLVLSCHTNTEMKINEVNINCQ